MHTIRVYNKKWTELKRVSNNELEELQNEAMDEGYKLEVHFNTRRKEVWHPYNIEAQDEEGLYTYRTMAVSKNAAENKIALLHFKNNLRILNKYHIVNIRAIQ